MYNFKKNFIEIKLSNNLIQNVDLLKLFYNNLKFIFNIYIINKKIKKIINFIFELKNIEKPI